MSSEDFVLKNDSWSAETKQIKLNRQLKQKVHGRLDKSITFQQQQHAEHWLFILSLTEIEYDMFHKNILFNSIPISNFTQQTITSFNQSLWPVTLDQNDYFSIE